MALSGIERVFRVVGGVTPPFVVVGGGGGGGGASTLEVDGRFVAVSLLAVLLPLLLLDGFDEVESEEEAEDELETPLSR